jgi:hypothetical protein
LVMISRDSPCRRPGQCTGRSDWNHRMMKHRIWIMTNRIWMTMIWTVENLHSSRNLAKEFRYTLIEMDIQKPRMAKVFSSWFRNQRNLLSKRPSFDLEISNTIFSVVWFRSEGSADRGIGAVSNFLRQVKWLFIKFQRTCTFPLIQ